MRTSGVVAGACGMALLLSLQFSAFAQGLQFPGIGPVNRSMGGAAAAAPLDAMGAIHWNPATITGLESSEFSASIGFIMPDTRLESHLPANTFGPGFPPVDLGGAVESDIGAAPLPSIGVVLKDDGIFACGLGIYGTAGFALNYPASTSSPLSMPPPPVGLGVGRVFAEAQVIQIAPVLAVRATERLSIGGGPTINLYRVLADPYFFTAPNDANGDGFYSWPDGTGSRYHWGGGFEVGVYYETDVGLNFGAGYKSKQRGEDVSFHSTDELGLPLSFHTPVSLPAILSLGTSYTGFERTTLAMDVRWINYADTDLLGDPATFAPDGRLRGLGWDSVWSVSVGAQHALLDWLSVRVGYTSTEEPVGDGDSGVNFPAPLIIQHVISTGLTVLLTDHLSLTAAYQYGLPNEISGPIQTAAGPIPGSRQSSEVSFHLITAGLTARF
jgi:long-chain fatty acid transport protein